MRAADVSQLAVVEGERIVGLIDESDLLGALLTHAESVARAFALPVKDVMTTRLETIPASAPISDLIPLFRKDYVAIVMDGAKFLGLITRIDLINHFRVALQ
jgi:cystathionine beta-synthase